MKRPIVLIGAAVGILALAVVAVVAVWLLRSDDPNLLTEAPAIPTSVPGAATTPSTSASGSDVDLPDGVRRFVVVAGESSAKYVVQESLRGLPATAVGTTGDVAGEVFLTEDGLHDDIESKFTVDLRTLKTDESMRDNYVRSNVLQTSRFPMAEFVIDAVEGFPSSYREGSEVRLTLTGTMKIKDVTKPVTFTVLARQSGNTLTATADTDFLMTDFGIDPPSVPVASAQDEVHLQIVLIARETA